MQFTLHALYVAFTDERPEMFATSFLASRKSAVGTTLRGGRSVVALYPGIRRPGRKAAYSPPTRAMVKNVRGYTSLMECTGTTKTLRSDMRLQKNTQLSSEIAV